MRLLRKKSLSPFLALLLVGSALATRADAADLGNIWPLGDSVTYGAGVAGGYRTTLYTNLAARGYSFQLVGTVTDNPSAVLTAAGQARHDGHSGYSITNAVNLDGTSRNGIYEGVVSWYGSIAPPDVILLLIGINDLNTDYQIATAPARLDLLVARLFEYFPHTRLLVASLPDADQNNGYRHGAVNNITTAVLNYNAGVALVVANHRAMGQNIALVDLHGGLTLADLADGLHPTTNGYVKMGNIWADAVVAASPQFTNRPIAVSGKIAKLTASGAVHTSYSLWSATNLASPQWTLVTNGTVPTNPFTLSYAATNFQGFYRLSAP